MSADYISANDAELLTIDEKADLMDQTLWLQDFQWNELKTLGQFAEVYSIEQGKLIFSEGATDCYMGIIVSGKVVVGKSSSEGKIQAICKLSKGMTFGEMSLIDDLPRSASVKTIEPSQVVIITKKNFYALLGKHPKLFAMLSLKISKLMSSHLRRTSALLIDSFGNSNK